MTIATNTQTSSPYGKCPRDRDACVARETGTSGVVTPRFSAMRLMIRVVASRSPCPSPVAAPVPAVLEHLHGVLVDAAVRLERGDGRHDHDVARGGLQRADALVEIGAARGIDDAGEVIHGVGQRRWRRLRAGCVHPCQMTKAKCQSEQDAAPQCSLWHSAFAIRHCQDLHPSTYAQIVCAAST